MAEHFDRSEPAGHVDRALTEDRARFVLSSEHVELRAIAQRHRQLLVLPERRQHVERFHRALSGLGVVAKKPRQPRQPSDPGPDGARHIELAPHTERLDSLHRASPARLAGEVALVRKEIGISARATFRASARRRASAVRGRLAMRTGRHAACRAAACA